MIFVCAKYYLKLANVVTKFGNVVAQIWCNVLYTGESSDISVLSLINTFEAKPSNSNNVTTNHEHMKMLRTTYIVTKCPNIIVTKSKQAYACLKFN